MDSFNILGGWRHVRTTSETEIAPDDNEQIKRVARKLVEAVIEEGGLSDPGGIDGKTFSELGMDPLDIFVIANSAEEQFEIQIDDEAIDAVETIDDLVRLIRGRILDKEAKELAAKPRGR